MNETAVTTKEEALAHAIREKDVQKIAEMCEKWEHTYARWEKYGSLAEIWAFRWRKKTLAAFYDARDTEEMGDYAYAAKAARRRLCPEYPELYLAECDFYFPIHLHGRAIIAERRLPYYSCIPCVHASVEKLSAEEAEKLAFSQVWWQAMEEEAKQIRPADRRNTAALAKAWVNNWEKWAKKAFREAKTKKELDIAFRLAQSAKLAYASEWLGGEIERIHSFYARCARYFPMRWEYEDAAKAKGFLTTETEAEAATAQA